ncbi:MAG TPA: cytochrome c biogenesis CcdA family protein [Actinomycetota bacterium]
MGGLLTTGSILAAFFAGAVALFSPCCIVFLFPAYLASGVQARRWRLLPLTFVFAAGIALVLLPVTLGIGLVSTVLGRYHVPLYVAGGLLMLGLGALAFSGRTWSLPSFLRAPSVRRTDAPGVFALGVFSGVASSCCAPVLAGVMTLSALSGSLVGAATLGLAYVFGMVFPLFVMALLWDRLRLGERRLLQARPVRVRLGWWAVDTNTVNLVVAAAFGAMGAFALVLAVRGDTTVAPGFQLAIGRWLSDAFERVITFLDPVPEPALGLALLAIAAGLVAAAFRSRPPTSQGGPHHDHRNEGEEDAMVGAPTGNACHGVGESEGGPAAEQAQPAAPAPR